MRCTLPRVSLCAIALLALAACASSPADHEASVKPGINQTFLDPNLDIEAYIERFEVESREIARWHREIVNAMGIQPGDAVVDIGAGTGLFLEALAHSVGDTGTVYAIDISEPFVEHMRDRAAALGLSQVRAQVCSEDSIDLPRASVDVAFACDVYHHFEYPETTLASIRRALRQGGEFYVVDFERIPGQTSAWLLEHVRAGKEVFTAEIEAAGFDLVEEIEIDGLRENYMLRFRRR
ncbi:MAG: class I SAM-dependent methyltransferase [Phycisphaerales bacterium]